MNPLAVIGRIFLSFLASVGDLTLFAGRALLRGASGPYYPRMILRQMIDIGYYSLPVVGLTAIFTGMVLALQSHTGFSRFEAQSAVATVARSMSAWCVSATPFGVAVVPEVKSIAAVSSPLPLAISPSRNAGSRLSDARPASRSAS